MIFNCFPLHLSKRYHADALSFDISLCFQLVARRLVVFAAGNIAHLSSFLQSASRVNLKQVQELNSFPVLLSH